MNAAQMQIRARITRVGSEYRKDVTSGTCELCIADWGARIRDISFELTDVNTGITWPPPSTSAGGTTSGRSV